MDQKAITEHAALCAEARKRWGEGPWQKEPDRLQWKHAGFACLMVRNTGLGNWCGYVGVPRDHPAYGKPYNDVEAHAHGGLTYAAKCGGVICHVPEPGTPEDVWWLGFDCAHFMDEVPGMVGYGFRSMPGVTYRDVRYVKREVNKLARELRETADNSLLEEERSQ